MSFEAGAITGKLGLDISEFADASREAGSIAGEFAEQLGHIFSAATGSQALGGLVNGIAEIGGALAAGNPMEAFSASLHTAGELGAGLVETIKHVAEEMHGMGLAAERAGVDVEWFSSFGKAAKSAGVNVDDLGITLKFLQRNAADAVEGNKELTKHFEDIGLSAQFVKEHLDDTQGLFMAVVSGLGNLRSEAEQTGHSMQLLGRGGATLKPLFKDGGKAASDLAQEIKALGGAFTEEDAKMGSDIGRLSILFGAAIDGMEKAVAKPFLQYLDANAKQVTTDIKALSGWFSSNLPDAIEDTIAVVEVLVQAFDHLKEAYDSVKGVGVGVGGWIGEHWERAVEAMSPDADNQRPLHYIGDPNFIDREALERDYEGPNTAPTWVPARLATRPAEPPVLNLNVPVTFVNNDHSRIGEAVQKAVNKKLQERETPASGAIGRTPERGEGDAQSLTNGI